ncbi:MAG: sigma-70 family RNA polymerase sigma factor [Deltaproteobacteria bacterium]|jgi:RNA polymerase sigma-70 factor (ECF subfamily)|nr:sigma-70 family RNA polymerase sigma factor [Deltaproteobacteria bacterium]
MPARKPETCSPPDLVALLRSGDVAAIDELARCYGQRLRAAARKHCRTPEEAEDAFQDALLNAWHARESFRGDGRLDGWMVRLVASACSRMRRGRKNAPELHIVGRELSGPSPSPEQDAFRKQLAEGLSNALLQLKPEDRVLLLLSDAHGWKGPELAEELGLTPGAVRTRLSRARAKLRAHLEPLAAEVGLANRG